MGRISAMAHLQNHAIDPAAFRAGAPAGSLPPGQRAPYLERVLGKQEPLFGQDRAQGLEFEHEFIANANPLR